MTERNNNSYMNYNELVQQYMRLTNGIQQNLRLASNMYDRIEQHTYSLLNNEMRYDLRRIVYNNNNNNNNNRESTENSSDERTREEEEFVEILTTLFSRRNNHSNPPANNRFGNLNTNSNTNSNSNSNTNSNSNSNSNSNTNSNSNNRFRNLSPRIVRTIPRDINNEPENIRNNIPNQGFQHSSEPRRVIGSPRFRINNTNGRSSRVMEFYEPRDRLFLRRPSTLTPNNSRTLFNYSEMTPVPIRATTVEIDNATEIVQFGNITNCRQNRCPIGLITFQNSDSVRRILHCGHIFLQENLERWFRSNVRCPLCRYDIREYDPRTAISNPFNTDVTNSNIPTPSPRRHRSNSADGDFTSNINESDDSGESDGTNYSSDGRNSVDYDNSNNVIAGDEHVDQLVTSVISEITNTLTHEVTAYLQQTFDLSNITQEQLNDISFNFATVTESVISTNDENASDVD